MFIEIVERHALLEKRFIRRNQVSFMDKQLRKALCNGSRLKYNFCKCSTKENEVN